MSFVSTKSENDLQVAFSPRTSPVFLGERRMPLLQLADLAVYVLALGPPAVKRGDREDL